VNPSDASEASQLVASVAAIRECIPDAALSHLDNIPGARIYVRDSDRIARALGRTRLRVLDWGCGYGQMSWLLARRGYEITAADVPHGNYDRSPLLGGVRWLPLIHPVSIDAPDGSFDAVVASGTLEHVDDMHASLRELRRVLKPNGRVFMFRFPNLYSYIEWLGRRAGGWHHSIRLTRRELAFFARINGLEVLSTAYETILPANCMCGYVRWLRPVRSGFDPAFTVLDRLLVRTPGVSHLSTSIRAVLQKSVDYMPPEPSQGP
jgi:2-polyprenyl-3-methyl-5-hydroxy-6-metoxy-1,4-benzoquinol methylase